jgi:excisionase family DNA binding protein
MHCTRIRARARLGVGSRAQGASAAVWRSAAKRRERARERAEQAGGFPAPWGGGRGVGKNLCNARRRYWSQPRVGLSRLVAVRSGDATVSEGIVALTWGGPSLFSGCSPDTVITIGPSGNRQLDLEPEIRGSRIRRDTALALARPRGHVSGAKIPNYEKTVSQDPVQEVPSLLTLKQAASRLAVCRRTLERLIAAREFPPPLKIGNCSRVPDADVQAYIAKLMRVRAEGRAS